MIHRITTRITRPARWIAALATLAALTAALAAGLSGALADHPSDLKLTLKVHDNAAAVSPQGSEITIDGEFRYTGAYDELSLTAGELRIGGADSPDWEETGAAKRLTLPAQRSGVNGALSGSAVAVQQRASGDGGDIVVVGAPKDWVGQNARAGSVDVFVDGAFVTRLTAGGNAAANAQFGASVDVAGGVIVVGAPFEGGILDHTQNDGAANDEAERPQGAVYVFTFNATDMVWERAARLTPENYPTYDDDNDQSTPNVFQQTRPIAKFGYAVAIDDMGEHIAVAHEPALVSGTQTTPDQNRWEALGQVFSKPSGAWANQSIVKADGEPEVAYLNAPSGVGLGQGDIDISGDGNVIALGVPDRDVDTDGDSGAMTPDRTNYGGVLIYLKPSASMEDWINANDGSTTGRRNHTAMLDVSGIDAHDGVNCMLLGASVALSRAGDFLVAGAPGAYTTPCGSGTGTVTKNTWKGAAFVFAKGSSAWATATAATAALTEPSVGGDPIPPTDGKAGELFGQAVAINDDGTRIIVGNAADPTDDHAKGYAHVYKQPEDAMGDPTTWAATAPRVSLASPETTTKLAFGAGVALDGADRANTTAVVGQAEALEHLSQISGQDNIISGHGRAYTFSLSSTTDSEWQGTAARLGPLTMPCTTSGSGDSRKWNCDLNTTGVDTRIVIVPGTSDGTQFTIAKHNMLVNTHDPGGDPLTVTVGELSPIDNVQFNPNPSSLSSVEAGATVNLRLSIRGGNQPATPQVIGSVRIHATGGQLSSPAGEEGSCSGFSCELDLSQLHSTGNNVILTNSIPVTWVAPSQTRTYTITATVSRASGHSSGPTLTPNVVTITVVGVATDLSLKAPSQPLFHRPTADDDRDIGRFEVTATDSEERSVAPPDALRSWTVVVSGSERSVKSQFSLTREPPTGRTNGKVYLDLRVTGTELSPGSYQLRATLDRAEGRRTFTLVGGPARIRLEDSGQRTIGGRLTYEARVLDSNGNAVVDGTEVTFELVRAPGTIAVIAPDGPRTFATSGGRASSTHVVVSTGSAVMKACAGDICDVKNFSVGGFIPPVGGGGGSGGGGGGGGGVFIPPIIPPTTTTPPVVTTPPPAAATFLTSRSPNTQAVWEGTGSARASELLDDLPAVSALFMWNGERWLPYGRIGTLIIPGSIDFVAFNGAIIWLAPLGQPAKYVTAESTESTAASGSDGGNGEKDTGEEDTGEEDGEEDGGEEPSG